MTVVGDKQILGTQTLLLGDGEVGRFDIQAGDTVLPVSVRFSPPGSTKSFGEWKFDDGRLALEFAGTRTPSKWGMAQPQQVGDLEGTPIGFKMAYQRIDELNV